MDRSCIILETICCLKHSPSSTISPAKTLAIPDIAMTTFWETDDPVIDWISWRSTKKATRMTEERFWEEKELVFVDSSPS